MAEQAEMGVWKDSDVLKAQVRCDFCILLWRATVKNQQYGKTEYGETSLIVHSQS